MKRPPQHYSHPATRPDDGRKKPKPGDGKGAPKKEVKKININISIDPEALKWIDEAAAKDGTTRSQFMVKASIKVIRMQQELEALLQKWEPI